MPWPAGCERLSFDGAQLTRSNLGGLGPDTESDDDDNGDGDDDEGRALVFEGLGSLSGSSSEVDDSGDGSSVALRVTNTTAYHPKNAAANGFDGAFGYVNVLANTALVGLQLCFVDGTTRAELALDEVRRGPSTTSPHPLGGVPPASSQWCDPQPPPCRCG